VGLTYYAMNAPDCPSAGRTPGRLLRTYAPAAPGTPVLVWFPFAGGTASHVAGWADDLPGVGLVGVQYPGRAERWGEPYPADVAALAAGVADALTTSPAGAILWGHSLGALVAWATARELERRGRRPRALVVTGRRAPGRPATFDHLADLDDDALVAALVAMDPDSRAPALRGDARRYVLDLVRADARLARTVLDAAPPALGLSVPLVAATGADDPAALAADLPEWAAFTSGPARFGTLVGGHLSAVASPGPVVALLRDAGLLTERHGRDRPDGVAREDGVEVVDAPGADVAERLEPQVGPDRERAERGEQAASVGLDHGLLAHPRGQRVADAAVVRPAGEPVPLGLAEAPCDVGRGPLVDRVDPLDVDTDADRAVAQRDEDVAARVREGHVARPVPPRPPGRVAPDAHVAGPDSHDRTQGGPHDQVAEPPVVPVARVPQHLHPAELGHRAPLLGEPLRLRRRQDVRP